MMVAPEREGINRNILECKYICCQRSYFSKKRINRNILECKYITEVNEDETGGQY